MHNQARHDDVRFQSAENCTMKNTIFILIVIFVGFITSSCSDTEDDKAQAAPDKQTEKVAPPLRVMTEIVEINSEVTVTEDKRIVVKGTTNLPNLTSLLISLNNEKSGFGAQDKINVSNNHFSTSPLGKITGLPDGHYTIEILMPLPSTQPEKVQAVIGKQGQHLTGPLVEDSEWGGNVVEKTIAYNIGSPESIAKNENQHYDLVASIKQETIKLLALGQEMENIRNTEDLNKLRSCGNQMRENQSVAKLLRQKSEELPLKYISLKAAIIDVYSCVSCSSSALEACERVKESLQESEI